MLVSDKMLSAGVVYDEDNDDNPDMKLLDLYDSNVDQN